MALLEIERKFLVKDETFRSLATDIQNMKQGYLSVDKDRTVRIRVVEDGGYITIKGRSSDDGVSRFEWEKRLSKYEAESLFKLTLTNRIEKTRYSIPYKEHVWTVDVFHAENEGLILAEIELETEATSFEKPLFIDREVTGDHRYYNSYLINNPYKMWLNA